MERTDKPGNDDADLAHVVEVWKKVIDVQQHFNDIELRIRNYALTMFAAVIGAGGLALQHGIAVRLPVAPLGLGFLLLGWFTYVMLPAKEVIQREGETKERLATRKAKVKSDHTDWRRKSIKAIGGAGTLLFVLLAMLQSRDIAAWRVNASLGAVIFLAGVVAWSAFFFMDKYWYHRLLLGAVYHGIDIEDGMASRLPQLGLSKRIGAESPFPFLGRQLHSSDKMNVFYGSLGTLLVVLAASAFFVAPRPVDGVTTVRLEPLPAMPPLDVRVQTDMIDGAEPAPAVQPQATDTTAPAGQP